MNQDEFAKAINQGLGRAIQHLQTHDAEPRLAAIEYACLKNTAYDPQCEETRDAYLFEIIELTGQSAYFLDRITQHLFLAEENYDLAQLYALTRMFAQTDFPEARKFLYERFDKFVTQKEMGGLDGDPWHRGMISLFSEDLLKLDGLDGLIWVADRLGQELNKPEDYYIDDSVLYEANERFGKNEVNNLFANLSTTNPNISIYSETLFVQEQKQLANRAKARKNRGYVDYQTFKTNLMRYEKGKVPLYISTGWSKRTATDKDLEEAALALLEISEPNLLAVYLRIFRWRRFPLGHDILLNHSQNEDEHVSHFAIEALVHVEHAEVRDLAIGLLELKTSAPLAIPLFTNNFYAGDLDLIRNAFNFIETSDDWHDFGWSFKRFFEVNLIPEAQDLLINLYEHTPCANCRLEFIKFMQQTNTLPNWIIEEGCFDCDSEIREFCKDISMAQSGRNFTFHVSRIKL